jgi:gas vesicle protein
VEQVFNEQLLTSYFLTNIRIMASNKAFWGIVTAAAVGAVIGLLFAPDEGNKTRKKIKKKTNSLAGELLDALEKSKEKAVKVADEAKEKGTQYKDEAIDAADEYIDDAKKEINKYN